MKKQEGSKSSAIKIAADILKKGGIVIFPTDTVYGIGSISHEKESISKIYQIKSRPKNLPLPVLIADAKQLEQLAIVTPLAKRLAGRYWPGGLTIVLKLKTKKQSLGFRIPDSKTTRDLITMAGAPIIGTSANLHGRPSVKTSKELDQEIVSKVDYVLEGECKGGVESTVIDLTSKTPKVIRQGIVKVKSFTLQIETVEREKVKVELKDNFSFKKYQLTVTQQTGSQALIPAIIKIAKNNKFKIAEIDAINVNNGPGSFTGTRVGVAVANALGYALAIPVNGEIGKITLPIYEKSKFD
ncbi:threonylcarbamoyl-AMP synthase [Candidatus Curtissbacteria bacterium]|nr:threonylcarbamoyl-AMP synthase [Candidatus Curtissbacteria bacterium]